jgi:hypothetical protein
MKAKWQKFKKEKNATQKCNIIRSNLVLLWVNWTSSTDHERY